MISKKHKQVEKANAGALMIAQKVAPKSLDSLDTKLANKLQRKSFMDRMNETGNPEIDAEQKQRESSYKPKTNFDSNQNEMPNIPIKGMKYGGSIQSFRRSNGIPKDLNWTPFMETFDVGVLDMDNIANYLGYKNLEDLEISKSPTGFMRDHSSSIKLVNATKKYSAYASDMPKSEVRNLINKKTTYGEGGNINEYKIKSKKENSVIIELPFNAYKTSFDLDDRLDLKKLVNKDLNENFEWWGYSIENDKTYVVLGKSKMKYSTGGNLKVGDTVYPESLSGKWKVISIGEKKTNKGKMFMGSDYFETIIENESGERTTYPSNRFGKGGKIEVGDFVKSQYGYYYQRVDGSVGGQPAFVNVENGKVKKRKTSLHSSTEITKVTEQEALNKMATGGNIERYPSFDDTLSILEQFDEEGLVEGQDYTMVIARGDDIPTAITPISEKAKTITDFYEDEELPFSKGGVVGISDLVVGKDYAIVDFGMGYWLNDWTYQGERKPNKYVFTSNKQFDKSEQFFTKDELLEYIEDGAITENQNVDDFEEFTKYSKGGSLNYLKDTMFSYLGENHRIKKIENEGSKTTITTTENRMFDYDKLKENGVSFSEKPERKKRGPLTPEEKRYRNRFKIAELQQEREYLLMDMEQEAEPEGGPVANYYGRELNRIDKKIAQLSGRNYATGGSITWLEGRAWEKDAYAERRLKKERTQYNSEQPVPERYTLKEWVEYELKNRYRGRDIKLKGSTIYFASESYARGGYLEGREEYEGYQYQIWYSTNKRMYSVSDNLGIFKGDNEYFETYDQAKEHAEISIRSMLHKDEKYVKGGNCTKYELGGTTHYFGASDEDERRASKALDSVSFKPWKDGTAFKNHLKKHLKDKINEISKGRITIKPGNWRRLEFKTSQADFDINKIKSLWKTDLNRFTNVYPVTKNIHITDFTPSSFVLTFDEKYSTGGEIAKKLARYNQMSDFEVVEWANENDMAHWVELDENGKLSNRNEVLTRILEIDLPNTDAEGNPIWHKFGGGIEHLKKGDKITLLGDEYIFIKFEKDNSQGYEEERILLKSSDGDIKSYPKDMVQAYSKFANGGGVQKAKGTEFDQLVDRRLDYLKEQKQYAKGSFYYNDLEKSIKQLTDKIGNIGKG